MGATDRCQAREGNEQCRLPAGHAAKHAFVGEPLSLLIALSWDEERTALVERIVQYVEQIDEHVAYDIRKAFLP